jgi:DNA adenine methylase
MTATHVHSLSELTPAPFLRWAGGKAALAECVMQVAGSRPFLRYFEPFLGGGAVFFLLKARGFSGRALLCDVNPHLVNLYQVVRDEPEALLRIVERQLTTEKAYYRLRALDPNELLSVPRAAWFLTLNRLCFNGLWRVNAAGRMNVPFGFRNVRVADHAAILAASKALEGAQIEHVPFTALKAEIGPKDFVYCDPPFLPLKAESFTAYAREGFRLEHHRKLARLAGAWARKGATVVLSNADVPAARQLYARGFTLHEVQMRRAINSNAKKRGPVGELLAVADHGRRTEAVGSFDSGRKSPPSAQDERVVVGAEGRGAP